MKKRILIVMPNLSLPPRGADEHNRLGIIRTYQDLGYSISIIAKVPEININASELEKQFGVSIIQYPYRSKSEKTLSYYLSRLFNPYRWDGAADEYFDEKFVDLVTRESNKEDVSAVLLEYTFLWPVARRISRRGKIPVIIRSHNFEPLHFLSEDGLSPVNAVKFLAKLVTEYKAGRVADTLLAITLKESDRYKKCFARNVSALHSGYLPFLLEKPAHAAVDHEGSLKLVFMGASYNIPHNRRAAEFLITEVMPALDMREPGKFHLFITGGKLPPRLESSLGASTTYMGYVPDIDAFLETIDIAVVPRVAGHGMQLKVFEPLVRGFPVITSRSALGGFPYIDGESVLIADTAADFADRIIGLKSLEKRRNLGLCARKLSQELFGRERTRNILAKALTDFRLK